MQLSTFHKLLKEETKPYHDELENENLPKKLFNLEISKDEYIHYLTIFLSIHHTIENQLLKFEEWDEFGFNVEPYFREKLIIQDLDILETKSNYIDLDIQIDTFSQALGYLYVLTGSTMGGITLSKKVQELFANTKNENANNYFSAFREKTHPMFFGLMGFMDKYSCDSQLKQNDIIQGAKECYLAVKKGFNGY